MKSKNTILNEATHKTFKKYGAEIEDIILFGSYMKGKKEYNDIDILIIFKNKINKLVEAEFKKELEEITNVDINSSTLDELKGEGFIAKEGLYLEGKSLLTNKLLSETIGFTSLAFIKYNISKIKGSLRTRLYYALEGRLGSIGFLKEINANKYSDNLIVCEYSAIEKIKEFLDHWKVDYEVTPALVPKRLRHLILKKKI